MAKLTYSEDERLYLQMMHGNIERMASNSANCKTWLVTMVAGFMAITCFDSLHWWLLLALVPIAMFWYLDGLYLSLERGMRNRQKDFLNHKSDEDEDDDSKYNEALFNFQPLKSGEEDKDNGIVKTTGQWWTSSVWPFYGVVAFVLLAVTAVLNWQTIITWF